MCSLENDEFWADEGWKRSVLAARTPELFEAWVHWVRTHM